MRELTNDETLDVSGGDWGQIAAGLGAIAIGIGVAATPVGWVGAAGAAVFSFAGGYAVGDGLYDESYN